MPRTMLILCLVAMTHACKGEETLAPSVEHLGRATGPVAQSPQTPPAATPPAMPPVHDRPGMMPPDNAGTEPAVRIKGEALETIDVTRYTYIRLRNEAGAEVWAAVPKTSLEEGEPVEIIQSLVMKDFESKTLNRTFPSIIFGVLSPAETP